MEVKLWPYHQPGKGELQADGKLIMTDIKNNVKWVLSGKSVSEDAASELYDEAFELIVLNKCRVQLVNKEMEVFWSRP